MPNINLIAARREEKQKITVLSRQLFTGLLGAAAILAVVLAAFLGQSVIKHSTLHNYDMEMAKLQPKLDRISQRESDIQNLKPRLDTLDNARLATLQVRAMMSLLSDALPSTVWLTGLSTQTPPSTVDQVAPPVTAVNLRGTGPTQARVAELAQRLYQNGNGFLDNVNIVSTANSSAPEDPVQKVTFTMTATVRPATLGALAADTVPTVAPSPSPPPAAFGMPAPPAVPTQAPPVNPAPASAPANRSAKP